MQRWASSKAWGTAIKRSPNTTKSALSWAIWVPVPTAMPRFAAARAGASFKPSPTIATGAAAASSLVNFWAGLKPQPSCSGSKPSSLASCRTGPWRSPLRIPNPYPLCLSLCTAAAASGRRASRTANKPSSCFPWAMASTVAPAWPCSSCQASASARGTTPCCSSQLRLPRRQSCSIPSTFPSTPAPAMVELALQASSGKPLLSAACNRAQARGWRVCCSRDAASCSKRCSPRPSARLRQASTRGLPRVRVPVLSNKTVRTSAAT